MRRDGEKHCGLRSADCGLKGKKPNPCAGSGQAKGPRTRDKGQRDEGTAQTADARPRPGFGVRGSARSSRRPPNRPNPNCVPYGVLRLRMCAAVLLNCRADTHEAPNAAGQETRRAKVCPPEFVAAPGKNIGPRFAFGRILLYTL